MGCSISSSNTTQVQDDIVLPAPQPHETCTFVMTPFRPSSSDHIVYRHEIDTHAKCLIVTKDGTFLNSDCTISVLNLTPNGEKDQVLWSCQFDTTHNFQFQIRSSATFFDAMKPPFSCDSFQNSNTDDLSYFKSAGWTFDGADNNVWAVARWSLLTSSVLSSHNGDTRTFRLWVFGCGTSICKYDTKAGSWTKCIVPFVDQLAFNLVCDTTNQVLASWTVAGDVVSQSCLVHRTPLFHLENEGGWRGDHPRVQTLKGNDPVFSLLVAYVTLREFSPSQLKSHLCPTFPDVPPASF